MKTQTDKIQEPQHSITPRVASESSNGGTAQLKDNRTSSLDQRKLRSGMDSMDNSNNPIQRKTSPEPSRRNKTGLPDNLKSGIENLSGYSMDDVKVHYNSSKPAQLQAHAYAQGTDIHLAPGQEKHLPHEAWHVVQQKQGRVQPTRQLKSKVNINDDAGLEREADVMGAKALRTEFSDLQSRPVDAIRVDSEVTQLKKKSNNAKVGIEIETTLPVRKNIGIADEHVGALKLSEVIIKTQYPEAYRPYITTFLGAADEARIWNIYSNWETYKDDDEYMNWLTELLNYSVNGLRTNFDPGYKTVVHEGERWKAMVDHMPKIRAAFADGELYIDSGVEIVTDPVSKISQAKKIMGSVNTWLTRVTNEAKGGVYIEGDYIYEIPHAIQDTLLPGGILSGNMQVNVGMDLKDVYSIVDDYANTDEILGDRMERLIREDALWEDFVNEYNAEDATNLMKTSDKPYLRSIIFQYLYLAIGDEDYKKRAIKLPKNRFPILPKTTIAAQIAVSSWKKKELWNEDPAYRQRIAIALDRTLSKNRLFKTHFKQIVSEGIQDNKEPWDIGDLYFINEPENLEIKKNKFAGVFELRHLQEQDYNQLEWLGIWKDYLRQSSFSCICS